MSNGRTGGLDWTGLDWTGLDWTGIILEWNWSAPVIPPYSAVHDSAHPESDSGPSIPCGSFATSPRQARRHSGEKKRESQHAF